MTTETPDIIDDEETLIASILSAHTHFYRVQYTLHQIIKSASERLKNNKTIALLFVKKGGDINDLSEEMRADREVVLAALTTDRTHSFLSAVSPNFFDDKEIALFCLKKSPYALEYLSERLRDDKEVVLTAVNSVPPLDEDEQFFLEDASERLKDDKEVILAAVSQRGYFLEYASDRLRADHDVVFAAMKNASYSLGEALGDYSENAEFLLSLGFRDHWDIYGMFQNVSPKLLDDENFMIQFVEASPKDVFRFCSDRLKVDKKFKERCKEILRNNTRTPFVVY